MTFISALILGLIASAHCAAMCSGLHQAMQPRAALLSRSRQLEHTLVMNLGRIFTYVIVGLVLATFSIGLWRLIPISNITEVLRIGTALLLILIGLQLFTSQTKVFSFLDPLADCAWSKVVRFLPEATSDNLRDSFIKGAILGLLPCGLLYAVFFTAGLSGDPLRSTSIMFGFGIGTLPSLVLSGMLWLRFKSWFHNQNVRVTGAAFFCLGGLLVLTAPQLISSEFSVSYPGLISLVFCS